MNESVRPKAPASLRVHFLSGWRVWLAWPFSFLMKLWVRTLRLWEEPEDREAYTLMGQPLAIVLWHNRLFMAAEMVRRYRGGRPTHALVSPSRDGAWLEAFFAMGGIRCVRGSSNRLGREAVSTLIDVLKRGDDIGITPDGPQGPCYEVKPGGLIVTRRTHAPMLVMGCEFSHAWRLPSWDRFYLPLPFSKVRMRARILRHEDLPQDREAAAQQLRDVLLKLNPDR